MANKRVKIWRYAKNDGKWKYLKPTYGRNNKIKLEEGHVLHPMAQRLENGVAALPQFSQCRTSMRAS